MSKFIRGLFYTQLLIIVPFLVFSQEQEKISPKKKRDNTVKGYFSWGYNKDWFSKSDLHFHTNTGAYDFSLNDVKAEDRPGFSQIIGGDISIPQYVYRIGLYFEKYNAGIEINFDHAKYVVIQDQMVHLKGRINETYYDTDTVLSKDFVQFEHTNGANFLLLNFVKQKKFSETKNGKFRFGGIAKIGAGAVIPKTDVTLFGTRLDNKFHVAGYIVGLETGFRFEMFKYLYLETTMKGSYADYLNVLTLSNSKANHHFWTLEAIVCGGIQIDL